jgi:hypothetical protein
MTDAVTTRDETLSAHEETRLAIAELEERLRDPASRVRRALRATLKELYPEEPIDEILADLDNCVGQSCPLARMEARILEEYVAKTRRKIEALRQLLKPTILDAIECLPDEPAATFDQLTDDAIAGIETMIRNPDPLVDQAIRKSYALAYPDRTFESFLADPSERTEIEQLTASLRRQSVERWTHTLDAMHRFRNDAERVREEPA